MDHATKQADRLFAVGPVSLLRWCEDRGRPINAASGELARRLEGLGVERLDDVLSGEDRSRLEAAMAGLPGDLPSLDLGPVRLDLGGPKPTWFHLTAVVDGARGARREVTATFVDINGLKGSERALKEKSDRLELVIEGTRLGTWDWNPQSGDVRFNEQWAEMLGYRLDEISSRLEEWESRVHPDDLRPCYGAIEAHLAGETSFYENVHRMKHRGGHWVHILDRGRVVERDAELAAQAANKIKSELLATMSHEIRTPLGGMMGLVEVLESTSISAAQRENMELIKRCGEHLGLVLDEVLELTRLESMRLELREEPFDLTLLLQDLHRLFLVQARRKGLELRLDVDVGAATWWTADRHRLHQVLSNLLSNAIKFTRDGYVGLRVWLEGAPERLCAAVEDTGRGIGDMDRIWGSFQQEDTSIAATYGGSGLGLTITQKLIQLMGGEIQVKSTVGEGSRFTFSIPIQRAHPGAPTLSCADAPEGDASADEGGLPALRVLAADDNEINRRIFGHFLAHLGVDFELVRDGEEATNAATRQPFDLILLDLQMPRRNGRSAAEAIRAQSTKRSERIVAVSADILDALQLEGDQSPFDAVVTKPISLDDIRAQLLAVRARRT
jgi:PAS domain S-box-containing protein